MRTTILKGSDTQERAWYLANGSGVPLGRLASRVARVLMGKHKPTYTPHVDSGDFVVVVNASSVKLTGKKLVQKIDYRHSGYPAGHHLTPYWMMMSRFPERTVELAVKGMLPKTNLGRKMIKKLKVFRGPDHPFTGRKPEALP